MVTRQKNRLGKGSGELDFEVVVHDLDDVTILEGHFALQDLVVDSSLVAAAKVVYEEFLARPFELSVTAGNKLR